MKNLKLIIVLLTGMALAGFATNSLAKDDAGKEMTITGMAMCAKCALHQADKCETVVQVTTDGKTVTYYLTGKEAKAFHEKICKSDGEKVTVTGKVTTGKDGKEMMHATKIEEVK
jgi:hypothetical protein